ncbi:MAG: transglycosylase SLT domain-containing protein, partial [Bacteroidetes bacterium]|nr:transglycosylase SLT domain-containing protein [Bacteroidota bacterium]
MRKLLLGSCLFVSLGVFGQPGTPESKDDKFVKTVEQSLMLFYQDYANSTNYDSIMRVLNYEANESPSFSDDVYCSRIKEIAGRTPMPFQCNEPSLSIIKYFAKNRRNFTRVVLGRSALYFDMFEEKLSEYNLPIELKYLAVIESGLRPQVKSRAGALGLWQFMYRTGLYFDLTENSYIDERMDPEKATIAACKYLKQLYGIYGDWFVALAAYNAGPGNVNKAIRRSGGKTNYWALRPFLPKETQGYVPNFIAATYMFTYHKEHNIIPIPAKIHHSQLDTMCLTQAVNMRDISRLINWDIEEIKILNPVYKTETIPLTQPLQCITGPLNKIGELVSAESVLYTGKAENSIEAEVVDQETGETENESSEGSVTHIVKKGETLASICRAYNVSIEDVMEWNKLGSVN